MLDIYYNKTYYSFIIEFGTMSFGVRAPESDFWSKNSQNNHYPFMSFKFTDLMCIDLISSF